MGQEQQEAPIIIDGYGDKGHDPCIIGYDQSPYAVYVYNSSQITIQNLEIVIPERIDYLVGPV